MIGLLLPVMIGMVALGTEIAYLLNAQRHMQTAADGAALGAATALQKGYPPLGDEARGISSYLGYTDGGSAGALVTVNNPPLSGSEVGNAAAVEVVISQPQPLSLVKLFYSGTYNVGARAVAVAGSGSYCVLQLGGSGTVKVSNGAVANLVQCGLAVNGASSSALTVNGGAQLNTPTVSVVGSASVSNGGTINPSNALATGQAAVADPYAGVVMPASSGCSLGNGKSYGYTPNPPWVFSPGVWCNGVSIGNGTSVKFNPGVYFIDRGTFNIGGGTTVTGAGVTIVLTSSTGSNYANATIGNGATITLSAPTTGATAGMVFFGDRRATPSKVTSTFQGGAAMNFTGAIYVPTQTLSWGNGAANTPSNCTELIAGVITFNGGANIEMNCPSGVAAIGGGNSSLVE